MQLHFLYNFFLLYSKFQPFLFQSLVVKPDQLIKRRGKLGLVGVNLTLDGVKSWLKPRLGHEATVSLAIGSQGGNKQHGNLQLNQPMTHSPTCPIAMEKTGVWTGLAAAPSWSFPAPSPGNQPSDSASDKMYHICDPRNCDHQHGARSQARSGNCLLSGFQIKVVGV